MTDPGAPRPTYWPAALALSCVLLLWGVVSSWIVSVVGFVILVASVIGWISDVVHDGDSRRKAA
jgi:uncharacterized membrane protein YecN with MAPEG domain